MRALTHPACPDPLPAGIIQWTYFKRTAAALPSKRSRSASQFPGRTAIPVSGPNCVDYLHTTSDVFVMLQPSDNADDSAAAEGVDPMLPTAEQPATAMRATRRLPWWPHRGGATTRFRLRTGGMIGLLRPCAEQPLPVVVIARAGPRADAADAQFAAVILTAKAQGARRMSGRLLAE